ncbi:putative pyridoxamine 5'-phosphate oxidase family protein [Sphingobacterium zeae]|uniref:Pyridoxamine 5'-phosphate oxidase family protein n=1 Tax=Sphingobacterium zeae TaxID=1776859 RepID=A0ABU0U4A2_9SPHI|nr:putative pyridoxamine 5'-phosphate oxidase family protein [Sphingobacterium zeae]
MSIFTDLPIARCIIFMLNNGAIIYFLKNTKSLFHIVEKGFDLNLLSVHN